MIVIWNEPPDKVVDVGTIQYFIKYVDRKDLEGYGPGPGKED